MGWNLLQRHYIYFPATSLIKRCVSLLMKGGATLGPAGVHVENTERGWIAFKCKGVSISFGVYDGAA